MSTFTDAYMKMKEGVQMWRSAHTYYYVFNRQTGNVESRLKSTGRLMSEHNMSHGGSIINWQDALASDWCHIPSNPFPNPSIDAKKVSKKGWLQEFGGF